MKIRRTKGEDSSAFGVVTITPSDDNAIFSNPNRTSRWIMVGGDGDLVLMFEDGSEAVVKNVISGVMYPFAVRKVKETGTTATEILAFR